MNKQDRIILVLESLVAILKIDLKSKVNELEAIQNDNNNLKKWIRKEFNNIIEHYPESFAMEYLNMILQLTGANELLYI